MTQPNDPPADLSQAGAIIDKAIEYMVGQGVSSLSVASALLGGALGLLARSLDDQAVITILRNAIASVERGDLRQASGDHAPSRRPDA